MNDVAAALKLSKGGLYHHFESKDEILFHIMSHAMQITEDASSMWCAASTALAWMQSKNACAR